MCICVSVHVYQCTCMCVSVCDCVYLRAFAKRRFASVSAKHK